ncbi:unnamed protein product, partial [Lymnaea stagnalis]
MGNKLRKFKDSIMNPTGDQEGTSALTEPPKEELNKPPANTQSPDTPLPTNTTAHTNAEAGGVGDSPENVMKSEPTSTDPSSANAPAAGQSSSTPPPVSGVD